MNDLQKLRYDLAMNCALVETLAAYQKDPEIDLYAAMWENFKNNYTVYCSLGNNPEFVKFLKELPNMERLVVNPSALVGKAAR